jgi:hypothetical protein
MQATVCDFCKGQIKGDYKQICDASTDILANAFCIDSKDMCMKCWKAFTEIRMIPLVEFPNTEAKDHE